MINSFKILLDDIKKSIHNDGATESGEAEDLEILELEEKTNRMKAKLISQGLRYLIRAVERKTRKNKREGIKTIKIIREEQK